MQWPRLVVANDLYFYCLDHSVLMSSGDLRVMLETFGFPRYQRLCMSVVKVLYAVFQPAWPRFSEYSLAHVKDL